MVLGPLVRRLKDPLGLRALEAHYRPERSTRPLFGFFSHVGKTKNLEEENAVIRTLGETMGVGPPATYLLGAI